MSNTLVRRLRERRDAHQFDRAMRTASPSMRQELAAAATRTTNVKVF